MRQAHLMPNTYEAAHGIPKDFIGVNAHNPDSNTWAQIERQEISVRSLMICLLQSLRRLAIGFKGQTSLAASTATFGPR